MEPPCFGLDLPTLSERLLTCGIGVFSLLLRRCEFLARSEQPLPCLGIVQAQLTQASFEMQAHVL